MKFMPSSSDRFWIIGMAYITFTPPPLPPRSLYHPSIITHPIMHPPLQDKDPSSLPHGRAYQEVWRDVRAAVDLCHRDGSIKREVAAHPSTYIHDVRGRWGGMGWRGVGGVRGGVRWWGSIKREVAAFR